MYVKNLCIQKREKKDKSYSIQKIIIIFFHLVYI